MSALEDLARRRWYTHDILLRRLEPTASSPQGGIAETVLFMGRDPNAGVNLSPSAWQRITQAMRTAWMDAELAELLGDWARPYTRDEDSRDPVQRQILGRLWWVVEDYVSQHPPELVSEIGGAYPGRFAWQVSRMRLRRSSEGELVVEYSGELTVVPAEGPNIPPLVVTTPPRLPEGETPHQDPFRCDRPLPSGEFESQVIPCLDDLDRWLAHQIAVAFTRSRV